MDIRSWKSLSADGQKAWDTMPEPDKSIILDVALEATVEAAEKVMAGRTGNNRPTTHGNGGDNKGRRPSRFTRTAKLHEMFNLDCMRSDQVIACMHALEATELEGDDTHEDVTQDNMTPDQLLQAYHTQTEQEQRMKLPSYNTQNPNVKCPRQKQQQNLSRTCVV